MEDHVVLSALNSSCADAPFKAMEMRSSSPETSDGH
jgi:hypothetical protein